MTSPLILVGGKPTKIAGALAMLFGQAVASAPVSLPPGPMVTTGQTGWWDASSLSGLGTVYSVADKSPANKSASIGAGAFAEARLSGLLGGVYARPSWPGNYSVQFPVVLDYAVTTTGTAAGSNNTFTAWLVWSRPNLCQPSQGAFVNDDVALLTIGSTDVLRMTARGDGTDTLVLFPTLTPVIGGTLERRHTHSVRVVFNGSTVDVWLDNAVVISATPNQITLGTSVNLSFLQNAQCVFHEAVTWDHALTSDEHATLSAYAVRWATGARRAANGMLIGQSNAGHLFNSSWIYIAYLVRYWTGSLSANLLYRNATDGSSQDISGGLTTFPGDGLYGNNGDTGKFLIRDDTTDPSTWQPGTEGNLYKTAIQSLTADQKTNLRYIFLFWGESLCSMLKYADKATCIAAHKRAIGLIRGWLTMTSAQLPFMVNDPLPFDTSEGCQTYREVIADLAADASLNVVIMLGLAGDAIGLNGGYDPATGIETGYNGATTGDTAHRDFADLDTYMHRCSIPIARAVLAANASCHTPDAITALDDSLPLHAGPIIASAHYEGSTYDPNGTILVTVQHDKGTDIKIPLRAAQGVGFSVMDGISDTVAGDPGTPGELISATACAYVSTDQFRITLAKLLSHAPMAKLYYGAWSNFDANYFAVIGRGNAVTDNLGSITLAPGWRVSQDKPSASSEPEQPNMPLCATAYGVPLT